MAVDAESKKFLEDVKKGKPRRFAMICKGVKILNLIVYKKGSEQVYKNRIKKADGAGQFYGGVITGKGKNIVFELLRESYGKPPGKELLLKQFLQDEAEMAFKPQYTIVDSLTAVDVGAQADESESAVENDLTDTDVPLSKTGPASVATQEPVPASSVSTAPSRTEPQERPKEDRDLKISEQLNSALENCRPLLYQVIEAMPDIEDDLIGKQSDIVDHIRAKQFAEARQRLGEFSHALAHFEKSLSKVAADVLPDQRAAKLAQAKRFKDRLIALMPQIQAGKEGNPEVATLLQQVQKQGQAKEFEAGMETLRMLSESLGVNTDVGQQLAEDDQIHSGDFVAAGETLATTLAKVVPAVKELLQSVDVQQSAKDELRTLVAQLKMAVSDDNLEAARKSVAKIVPAMKTARTVNTETVTQSQRNSPTVALTHARLSWHAARKRIESDIARFKAAVLKRSADEEPAFLRELTSALDEIDSMLGSHAEHLEDVLDEGLNAETDALRRKCREKAQAAINDYQRYVASNSIVRYIDSNSFAHVEIAALLKRTLHDLQSKLDDSQSVSA